MYPGIIIFINNDLSASVQATLTTQLYIDESMDGYEFDSRVQKDPSYPLIVHEQFLRIMVIRSFYELTNRNLADVVLFAKSGLINIERGGYGPPGQVFPITKITVDKLLAVPRNPTVTFIPAGVQNNIFVPIYPPKHADLYPFGSSPVIQSGGKGKFIKSDDTTNIINNDDEEGGFFGE